MKRYQMIVLFVAIGFATSREISRPPSDRSIENNGNKYESTEVIESRKHKPYHDLFLFMGGLQSLVTFIVIKIKVVLLVATIVGFAALAFKLYSLLKYTGYSYKNYPPIVAPSYEYSSYPGPALSPYSSSHHDHDVYANDWPPHGESYGRSSNQPFKRLNTTEMMYTLGNVDKEACQLSLLCQFGLTIAGSPFFDYHPTRRALKRRDTSNNSFGDCNAYYERCLDTRTDRLTDRRKRRNFANGNPSDYRQIVK